jgi:hypothetical protein
MTSGVTPRVARMSDRKGDRKGAQQSGILAGHTERGRSYPRSDEITLLLSHTRCAASRGRNPAAGTTPVT